MNAETIRTLIQEHLAMDRRKWQRYIDPDCTMPYEQTTYEERLKYIMDHWPTIDNGSNDHFED